MTRPFTLACLALAILSFSASKALAQIFYPPVFYPRYPSPPRFDPPFDPVRYPVEIGGYAAIGGASNVKPATSGPYFATAAGIYGQWNRYGLCPGLDLRLQGNREYIYGYLVGPRVAYQPKGKLNPLRLYGEALFGKNEFRSGSVGGNGAAAFGSQAGVRRAGVIGLDIHPDSAFTWRVLEFTKGDFTGIPGSYPQSITTGIVLHLP